MKGNSFKYSDRGFESEELLIQNFLDTGFNRFFRKGYKVTREFEIGSGRADILLVQIDERSCLFKNKVTLNPTEILISSILYHKKPISIKTLKTRTGLDQKKLLANLTSLTEKKLIEETSLNCYIKNESLTPYYKYLVSIEGKLSRWEEALTQAYRNRLFSNESYVLLDNKYIYNAYKNLNSFKQSNVGLISIDAETRETRMVFRPKKTNPLSNHFVWRAGYYLKERI